MTAYMHARIIAMHVLSLQHPVLSLQCSVDTVAQQGTAYRQFLNLTQLET